MPFFFLTKGCNTYFQKWKVKINPAASQAIIFPLNKSPKRLPYRKLNFENYEISVVSEIKYLGTLMDKKTKVQ